jgi:hypothetical protein
VPWTSAGPAAAIAEQLQDSEKRKALQAFEVDVLAMAPPPGYAAMNEAQRDAIYFERAREFVVDHPVVAAELAIAKGKALATKFGLYGLALLALAMLGAMLVVKDPRSWPVTLMVVATGLIFLLAIPYVARYRSPIEPSIVVLAAIALRIFDARLQSAFGNPEVTAARATNRAHASTTIGHLSRCPQQLVARVG